MVRWDGWQLTWRMAGPVPYHAKSWECHVGMGRTNEELPLAKVEKEWMRWICFFRNGFGFVVSCLVINEAQFVSILKSSIIEYVVTFVAIFLKRRDKKLNKK
jgi:hypothetical protein